MSLQGRLLGRPIAHRGLWRASGPPENSLAAFEAACAANYGIELDVRLTADGEAVVFHDESLERMTAESGLTEERTLEELTALRLLGSNQSIPTLEQTLALIAGRSVVLVELKTPPGQEGALEQRVAALLAAYAGPCGVLSFNPEALACIAQHGPAIARGLNARTEDAIETLQASKAHFLSVSQELAGHERAQDIRGSGRAVIAWTIRNRAEWDRASPLADNLIFEGFAP